jgi:hypothetical protein
LCAAHTFGGRTSSVVALNKNQIHTSNNCMLHRAGFLVFQCRCWHANPRMVPQHSGFYIGNCSYVDGTCSQHMTPCPAAPSCCWATGIPASHRSFHRSFQARAQEQKWQVQE